MPLVLSDGQTNLFFYIYTNDHAPAHVHVFVGRKKSRSNQDMKISIGDQETRPELLMIHPEIKRADIKKAFLIVAKEQEMLLKKWNTIHGSKKSTSKQRQKIV